jgi:hypothetical protein
MPTPGSLHDLPTAVSNFFEVVEYILFRLLMFISFVLLFSRFISKELKEWRKR